jgi:hypothetical protein
MSSRWAAHSARPNDQLTRRAGCKERDVAKNRNAGPIKCNALVRLPHQSEQSGIDGTDTLFALELLHYTPEFSLRARRIKGTVQVVATQVGDRVEQFVDGRCRIFVYPSVTKGFVPRIQSPGVSVNRSRAKDVKQKLVTPGAIVGFRRNSVSEQTNNFAQAQSETPMRPKL